MYRCRKVLQDAPRSCYSSWKNRYFCNSSCKSYKNLLVLHLIPPLLSSLACTYLQESCKNIFTCKISRWNLQDLAQKLAKSCTRTRKILQNILYKSWKTLQDILCKSWKILRYIFTIWQDCTQFVWPVKIIFLLPPWHGTKAMGQQVYTPKTTGNKHTQLLRQ